MDDREPTAAERRSFPGLERVYHAPYFLLILTELFWAGNFVLGRAVRDAVPPVALAFWRWFGGFLVVLIVARHHLRRDLPSLRAAWPMMLLLSAFGIAAFNTFVYLGLQSTTAISALLEQSIMPVVILLCSYLLFRDRVTWMQVLGVIVSLTGVVVIVTRGEPLALLEVPLNRGDAWVLAAVLSYALYSTLLRRRPSVHPTSFLATTFLIGAMMIAPFYVWEGLAGSPLRFGMESLLAIGYVAFFPSVLAYFCYNRAVELVGANRAGQFMHLMPAFGSVLAILLLGEAFRLFHALGGVLIFAGIVLASRARAG